MWISYDQLGSNTQKRPPLVVDDAHELSAGQGSGPVNLLTALLYQTAHNLSGTRESHMITGEVSHDKHIRIT